jgi:hypothetical protein
MRTTKLERLASGDPSSTQGAIVRTDPTRTADHRRASSGLSRTSRYALGAVAAVAATLGGATNALAATVSSATLTWNVPYTTNAAGGSLSLAGYATSIGTIGGATGNVTVSGTGTTGGPITSSSAPAPGTGVSYPFTFPAASTIGTYDPTAGGSMAFAGTLTFTAHSSTFLKVIDPKLFFDGPSSIRVVAGDGGEVSPPQDAPANTPPTTLTAGQTVFALNPGTSTTNPDGSVTMSGLAGAAATGGLSSNAAYNSIRDFFANRALNTFAVTFSTGTPTATAQCSDGVDNDGDTKIDLADPGCTDAADNDETDATTTPSSPVTKTLPVTGTVGQALSLTLANATADLGTFLPGLAQDYTTSIAATVTATTPSKLTVEDSGASPGFLVNGTAKLLTALGVRAGNTATPASTYTALGATPATLLTYAVPVNGDAVTIGLKQAISATEPLTTGTYGKTLTFTVSTTSV